jgi:nucleotide-binding universal stress UspA family protein
VKKILLAYDGGEPARRALETAADLARVFEASVSVMEHVGTHAESTVVIAR